MAIRGDALPLLPFSWGPQQPRSSVAIVHGLTWSPSLSALGIRARDLDHEAVGIVEVNPMRLPAVLDLCRDELADDLVRVEILDRVGVVAQAGGITPEQSDEAVVVAPAQDPEEIPLLVDDPEAEVARGGTSVAYQSSRKLWGLNGFDGLNSPATALVQLPGQRALPAGLEHFLGIDEHPGERGRAPDVLGRRPFAAVDVDI